MINDDKRSKPFFEIEEVVNACDPLSKLVRLFYTQIGMTNGDWDRKYNDYCYKTGIYDAKKSESQRGNIKRQLQSDDITFKTFRKGICDIAGGKIRDISVTVDVNTPDGRKTIVVSLSDCVDEKGRIIPKNTGGES